MRGLKFFEPIALIVLPLILYGSNQRLCPIQKSRAPLSESWSRMLALALDHSKTARTCIQAVAGKSSEQPLRELALLLIEEWDYSPTSTRLEEPVLIWRPQVDFEPLPAEDHVVSAAYVMFGGEVSSKGAFIKIRLIRSSGNPRIDDLCRAAASKVLYRPARRGKIYFATKGIVLQFHLNPRLTM